MVHCVDVNVNASTNREL